MLQHIDISGISYELDEDIKRYTRRKIGKLDRFVPRNARRSMHADVKLRQGSGNNGNKYECEVVFHVPEEQLTAKDSTVNMYAAVDIVEEKMKNLLHKYKEKHSQQASKGGGILGRFKRRGDTTRGSKTEPIGDEI